jgi:hypothetical protein
MKTVTTAGIGEVVLQNIETVKLGTTSLKIYW